MFGNKPTGWNSDQNYANELEQLLMSYNELFNEQSFNCLYKWPIFIGQSEQLSKAIFERSPQYFSESNMSLLSYYLNNSENTLNKNPNEKKVSILFGLNLLLKRSTFDEENSKEILKFIEDKIKKDLSCVIVKEKTELAPRLRKIQQSGIRIREKLINIEAKANELSRVSNGLDIKSIEQQEANGKVNLLDKELNKTESRIDDVQSKFESNYFQLNKSDELMYETSEKIKGMPKANKESVIAMLKLMQGTLRDLSQKTSTCERDVKEIINSSKRHQFY